MAFALTRTSSLAAHRASAARARAPVGLSPLSLSARKACLHTLGGAPHCTRSIRTAARSGAGVLDAPLTTLPGQELGKDLKQQKPPTYKVMLHNDNYNRREYVVKILLKIISMTVDDAVVAMQEAHDTGVAMVIACPQEDAEQYCEGLRLNGLTSTIEPGR